MAGPEVFVEDWAATYGSPYLVAGDEGFGDTAELVEDGPGNPRIHLVWLDDTERQVAANADVDTEVSKVLAGLLR